MRNGLRHLLLACVIALLSIACRAQPAPPPTITVVSPTTVTLGVTGSAADLPELVAVAIESVNVTTVVSNAATLYTDLAAGNLDAILVHTLPPEVERGGARWFNPVALDGLAFAVHPDNPIGALSLAQAQAIFSGKIDNWSQLGGPDLPIEVVSREPGSGARTVLAQRVMAEQRLTINAIVQPSSAAVRDYVAAHVGAIGYVMMGSTPRATMDATQAVRLLAVDGVAPTPQTTADQSYPLTVPLFFVHADSAEPQGALRLLIARLQSDDGQSQLGVRYGRVR